MPVATTAWENWVFVRLAADGPSLEEFLGPEVVAQVRGARACRACTGSTARHYVFDCNWKVFVDNYLDGGYHVPYLHEGLGSVLDYHKYTIENGRRHCLQSSPMVTRGAEAETGAVRKGERALYYWFYPNFMFNWYEGVMDTNLVYPRGVDQTEVIFDFWFADVSEAAREFNRASIDIANRVQDEDEGICRSVQRGLHSRAYDTGRLSVRREAGEQLFHRLLHADLQGRRAARLTDDRPLPAQAHAVPRAHRGAVPAAELAPLGRPHRGRLLRPRPRPRVLGDPQRRGADRRLAADEVPDRRARTRRGCSTRSRRATSRSSRSGRSTTRAGATTTASCSTTAR